MAAEERAPRRPQGLGRGLSSLLGEVVREEPVAGDKGGVQLIAIGELEPHPTQPRRHFDEDALEELAASIAARGLLQPIVVREKSGRFQIVAGERRWRAAKRAGLTQVPVIVREFNDAETLEVALLENIQRQDLNAIEEADGYRRLIAEYGHSAEALGRLVNKSRSHVANLLRLLDLPEPVREAVAQGQLSMGHARAIATATDPAALAQQVIAKGLSVRQTEALMQEARPPRRTAPRARGRTVEADADIQALERQLADITGLKVRITHAADGGAVNLVYASLDQLDMICKRLSGEAI
ncbi:MAG TPA: ParB/RepB/Spo0J family partition protein [Sphingomonadaceae bacterium]|nr:ParB/RepB/Spo0J family partition protein [Sphingomonadaceae bacterium]